MAVAWRPLMGRLKTIPPRVTAVPGRLQQAGTPSQHRITGRRLQSRRLRVWAKDPHCAECRQLVAYPDGFHLDHVVALVNGGQDTDENTQVLCLACHDAKTRRDLGQCARS